MRREHIQAVSSALLLTFVVFIPHHSIGPPGVCSADSAPASPGPLISEFYPRGFCDDEYIVLSNQCGFDVNLRNWSLTDGEGRLVFVSDIWHMNGRSFSISWNQSSFWRAYGKLPDVAMDVAGADRLVQTAGSFRLGDAGDSVTLYSPNNGLADAVIYGSTNETSAGWSGKPMPGLKQGEVAKRMLIGDSLADTNSAQDWMPFREFRYGYTDMRGVSVEIAPGKVTAFASPDNSQDVILDGIGSAVKSIHVCSYEFSSIPVTKALVSAKERGIDVRVLVDGIPSGGMSDSELSCLSVLSLAGADVLVVKGNTSSGVVQHIGALHAKYLVIDSFLAIVMSENLVEQGVPTDRIFGNRGWGVEVSDAAVAGFVEDLFLEDSRLSRRDIVAWPNDARFNGSAELPGDPATNHTLGMFEPLTSSEPARVTSCLSPDLSLRCPYLAPLIECARTFIGEQFQADLNWQGRWSKTLIESPLISSLEASLKRSGTARLLLDSSWYNVQGNGAVVNSLVENTTLAGMDGQFALLDSSSPIIALHNKGAIIDGRTTLISSNNWVFASFARNREFGFLVDSVEIADYFTKIFESDWVPDRTPPIAIAGDDIRLVVGESVEISSESSRDDRLIAFVSWDIDGDGQAESWNRSVNYTANVPGSHLVVLTVEDAWGNKATDEVTISVVSPEDPGDSGKGRFGRGIEWTVPVIVAVSYLVFKRMRGRDSVVSSRKLNHRPKD